MEEIMKEKVVERKREIRKFHKKTFEKIPEERRKRVLDVAMMEFAANGFKATNINVIAKKAEVSIGSIYSYFASKEDLFLTVLDQGLKDLEKALTKVAIEGDIFIIFEQLLREAGDYAKTHREINQIYLDITTQGLSNLSDRLSKKLEAKTAKLYYDVIVRAKEEGVIDANNDPRIISFCIDNLILMYQFSYTSDYYRDRMKIFLGEEVINQEEKIIKSIMDFIRKALKP